MPKKRRLRDDPIVRLVKRHGIADVSRAMGFAAAWAVVEEDLGRPPSIREYQAWWRQSERTTFREQAAFRKVLGFDSPAELVARARELGLVFEEDQDVKSNGLALLPIAAEMAS
jgi:signal recognition particle subunit SEC65